MLHQSGRSAHRVFGSARGSTTHKLDVQGAVAVRIDVGNRNSAIGPYAHVGATGGGVRTANGFSLSGSAIQRVRAGREKYAVGLGLEIECGENDVNVTRARSGMSGAFINRDFRLVAHRVEGRSRAQEGRRSGNP